MKNKNLEDFVISNGYAKGLSIFMTPDGKLDILAVNTSAVERQGFAEVLKNIVSQEFTQGLKPDGKAS